MLDCTTMRKVKRMKRKLYLTVFAMLLFAANFCAAQTPHVAPPPHNTYREAKEAPAPNARPKLLVLLVVDQMRGDYVDKFKGHWTGGRETLLDGRAWVLESHISYA